jgi:hypothetical protein
MMPPPPSSKRARISDPIPNTVSSGDDWGRTAHASRLLPVHHSLGCCSDPAAGATAYQMEMQRRQQEMLWNRWHQQQQQRQQQLSMLSRKDLEQRPATVWRGPSAFYNSSCCLPQPIKNNNGAASSECTSCLLQERKNFQQQQQQQQQQLQLQITTKENTAVAPRYCSV